MTKLKFLGAAAILSTVIAMPVMAQQALPEPDKDTQYYPSGNSSTYSYGQRSDGGDSFAYYGGGTGRGYDAPYTYQYNDRPVSRRTTCGPQPGATYLGPDGRWYPC